MLKRILFVEDDKEYGEMISQVLRNQGYIVDYFYNPLEALEHATIHQFDCILSDYKLGLMTGVKVVSMVRNMQRGIKVVILTGCDEESCEIDSVVNGVDMFLSKDKSIKVLLTYINQVLSQERTAILNLSSTVEKIVVNTEKHEVYKDSVRVNLTPKEYMLLQYFLENKNKKITRQEFIEKVWHMEYEEIDPRIIDVHIKNLRDKLQTFSIVSIRGFGYKWHE